MVGKEVEPEPEEGGGIIDGVWQGKEEREEEKRRQEQKQQTSNGEDAPKADSPPPPTDLDSFLESI